MEPQKSERLSRMMKRARVGRRPLSRDGVRRVTTSLAPEHFECIALVREKWGLGGAPLAAVIRKALMVAAGKEE